MPKPRKFVWIEAFRDDPNLDALTKLVLHTIASHMNGAGKGAHPSIRTIKNEAAIDRRAAITHVQKAVAAGWLAATRQRGGRGGFYQGYEAAFPRQPGAPGAPGATGATGAAGARAARGTRLPIA